MSQLLPVVELRWPEHLLPLKEVDNLLRCGICFDYFNIAMIIPQCSHNYCSLCIRKSLSYKAQCPTCCVAATGPDLKNNRILDELVQNFISARQWLFQTFLDSPPVSSPALFTRKAPLQGHIFSSPDGLVLEEKKPFADAFAVKENIDPPIGHLTLPERESKKINVKQEENSCSPKEDFEIVGKDAEYIGQTRNFEMPSTSTTSGVIKVECPVCGVPIQKLHINNHLDSCLTRDEKKESLRSSGQKRKLLPKVVYNLLSGHDLKKRLKEYGMSTQGTKQQLVKRHQEFVHMYNSQCDSLNPKSVAEIVKELENIEKVQVQLGSSKLKEDSLTFTKHQTENEIDEIHRDYRKKHKAEFQLLIDQMKRKKNSSTIKVKEEKFEQNDATTEKVPMDIGETLSNEEQTDLGSVSDQSSESAATDIERSHSPVSSFQSLASSNSSSSDIIRDLEIAGMHTSSSEKNILPDLNMAKQKSPRSGSSLLISKSKRRKK